MINKSNYEAYMIDFLDGNLKPHEEAALLLFLEEHPEIRAEFDGLEDVVLRADSTPALDTSSLVREPAEDKDLLLAKLLEGDLEGAVKAAVEERIQKDAEWAKDWAYMQATVVQPSDAITMDTSPLLWSESLTATEAEQLKAIDGPPREGESVFIAGLRKVRVEPDLSITYRGKSALKRTPVIVMRTRWAVAIAASIALLLTFPLLNPSAESSFASRIGNQSATTTPVADLYPQQEKIYAEPSSPQVPVHAASLPQTTPQVQENATPDRTPLTHMASLKPSVVLTGQRSPVLAGFEESLPTLAQLPEQKPKTEDFVTGREFFTSVVKKNLWGAEDYPEQGYVMALAEKGVNKISDKLSVDVPTAGEDDPKDKKGFSFRLGAFEIER